MACPCHGLPGITRTAGWQSPPDVVDSRLAVLPAGDHQEEQQEERQDADRRRECLQGKGLRRKGYRLSCLVCILLWASPACRRSGSHRLSPFGFSASDSVVIRRLPASRQSRRAGNVRDGFFLQLVPRAHSSLAERRTRAGMVVASAVLRSMQDAVCERGLACRTPFFRACGREEPSAAGLGAGQSEAG